MSARVGAIDLNRPNEESHCALAAGGSPPSRCYGAPRVNRPYLGYFFTLSLACLIIGLTSCQNLLRYHLLGPARDWQARSGQVLYRGVRVHVVGEVLVRYSRAGDFELTVTKGPGVPLFILRQNADFARVQGPLARGTWSGPVAHAPMRLRGWLGLRSALMQNSNTMVKYSEGAETFVFQF